MVVVTMVVGMILCLLSMMMMMTTEKKGHLNGKRAHEQNHAETWNGCKHENPWHERQKHESSGMDGWTPGWRMEWMKKGCEASNLPSHQGFECWSLQTPPGWRLLTEREAFQANNQTLHRPSLLSLKTCASFIGIQIALSLKRSSFSGTNQSRLQKPWSNASCWSYLPSPDAHSHASVTAASVGLPAPNSMPYQLQQSRSAKNLYW